MDPIELSEPVDSVELSESVESLDVADIGDKTSTSFSLFCLSVLEGSIAYCISCRVIFAIVSKDKFSQAFFKFLRTGAEELHVGSLAHACFEIFMMFLNACVVDLGTCLARLATIRAAMAGTCPFVEAQINHYIMYYLYRTNLLIRNDVKVGVFRKV